MSEELTLTSDPGLVVDRSTGIGASEIAAVVGLDPYTTPFDLYMEKTGQAPPRTETAWMYLGKLCQRGIIARYEKETNQLLVVMFDEPIRHPKHSYLYASPDAINPALRRNIEAKTVFSPRVEELWGEPGTDQVPETHILQAHAQMSVLDYDVTDIPVVLPRRDFAIYTIQRDRDLEQRIIELAGEFWTNHVIARVPPPVGVSEKTDKYIKYLFPRSLGEIRRANEEEEALAVALHHARQKAKLADLTQSAIENELKLRIGESQGIKGDTFRITWRNAKDAVKTDWEAVAKEALAALGFIASVEDPSIPTEIRDTAADVVVKSIPSHTIIKPGARRFLPAFIGEEE